MKRQFALLLLPLLIASGMFAQADASQRILFPILSKPFAGNLGSLWHTELSMLIDTEDEIAIFPLVDCVLCEDDLPRNSAFPPPFFFQQPGHPPGSIIYVAGKTAVHLHFSLRVRDASLTDAGAGTEIPVVREEDLFTGKLHLLAVPLESGFRQTLRLYDLNARPAAAVVLRVFTESGHDPLVNRIVGFSFSPAHNPFHGRPLTPGYIQLDLSSFPELSGLDRVRIEIQPVTPELEFWAFVTITNNLTQQVTAISPQ